MKGYYKNWYQHYLDQEEQKGKDVQRGYYSNFASPESEAQRKPEYSQMGRQEEMYTTPKFQHIKSMKKRKTQPRFLSALLPVATIFGFIFLWYQMDAGPVRHLVNEALVFARVREATIDVISYHTNLLDQHVEFAEKVSAYIDREGELSFDDLESLYDEIRAAYIQIIEISEIEHEEAIRLWSYKISNTQQMMNDLIIIDDDDIIAVHAQFMMDQEELALLIRAELMIEE